MKASRGYMRSDELSALRCLAFSPVALAQLQSVAVPYYLARNSAYVTSRKQDPSLNMVRLRKLVDAQDRMSMPQSLAEYLVADLPSVELRRERNYIIENYARLKAIYVKEVQPYIHSLCDMSTLLNDAMFYLWLQGKQPTAEDLRAVRLEGDVVKHRYLRNLADTNLVSLGDGVDQNSVGSSEDNYGEDEVTPFADSWSPTVSRLGSNISHANLAKFGLV